MTFDAGGPAARLSFGSLEKGLRQQAHCFA
jgi:hypothetical protein